MMRKIAIRKETKSHLEKRTPLTPQDVQKLQTESKIQTIVQPAVNRIFADEEYVKAGAILQEQLDAPFIFGIKELPISAIAPHKTYIFFSHTLKGQPHNMPLLQKIIDSKSTLIDYERIVDRQGKRLIAFGKFAGIAGMIDTLWALGQRWHVRGYANPLQKIHQAYNYNSIEEYYHHSQEVGEEIRQYGFPEVLSPVVIGIAGYGNVSQGAQEPLRNLPIKKITPEQLPLSNPSNKVIYQVIFQEKDTVKRLDSREFDLNDYYAHPDAYQSVFADYLPQLSALVNAIYWDKRYPRLLTRDWAKKQYHLHNKLQVVGDISCDIGGAIEITKKATIPEDPIYVYNPQTDNITMGYQGDGILVLAIDILPSEVPREASVHFSELIIPFIKEIVYAQYPDNFLECTLPAHLRTATIVYKGELTPAYRYLHEYL